MLWEVRGRLEVLIRSQGNLKSLNQKHDSPIFPGDSMRMRREECSKILILLEISYRVIQKDQNQFEIFVLI